MLNGRTENVVGCFLLGFLLVILVSCGGGRDRVQDYFGQEVPSVTPQVFAPGVISLKDRREGNANFSPDGKEFYFNVSDGTDLSIYWSKFEDAQWSAPVKLDAIGDHNNWEPFISYDSKELLFVSSRPPGNPKYNGRIWKSIRDKNGKWLAPVMLDLGYETKNGFWFPNYSKANKNVIYFGGNIEKHYSKGKGDLYYFDRKRNEVKNIEVLNSEEDDWDPFIAPDETFILWASKREGGFGGTDLYVSFKAGDAWGEPINLGNKINTPEYEVAPRISSDGKVLFFDRPINGTQDIYWVSSSVIEALRR